MRYFVILVLLSGCARFTTTQTDIRYDEQTGEKTTITTKVSAWTFGTSRSRLSTFKASQTEKTQSAIVGDLNQVSEIDTNTANIIGITVGQALKSFVRP